ncbi:MAG: radical SAM protein [Elusimicrobiota bacterium]
MRVAFIRPNLIAQRSTDAMEPLAFAILAALSPPGTEHRLRDERVEPVSSGESPDLAAFSLDTYSARRAYDLAAAYRSKGVPVVMGGHHPTLVPEEAAEHADCVVVADAEAVWPQLLEDFQAGRLKKRYQGPGTTIPAGRLPDRGLFKGKGYGRLALVQFSRNCPHRCDFCSIPAFYGTGMRLRPKEDVIREVEALSGRPFFLVDDNLFGSKEAARELLEALVPLRSHWCCQLSMDAARDDGLMDLLAKAGCVAATIGFESLDRLNLEQMGKKPNLSQDYAEVVRRFHDRGVMVYATFVFGYDYDTQAAFDAVLEFCLRSKVCLANFNPLTPMPGTRLHKRLEEEGRLLFKKWWLDPGYRYGDAVFRPRGMAPEALAEGCFRVRREFNRFGSILLRGLNFKANSRTPLRAGLYLAANLVSRREIYRKQGAALGAA